MRNIHSIAIILIFISNLVSSGIMDNFLTSNRMNKIDSTPLLKSLGITPAPDRPRRRDPPQYMLDLYQEISKGSAQPASLLSNASTIRALYEIENYEKDCFLFAIDGLSKNEVVLQSEFLVYYSHLRSRSHHHLPSHHFYELQVYAQTKKGSILLDSHFVTNNDKGMQKFQLGSSIREFADFQNIIHLKIGAKDLHGRILKVQFHHGTRGSTAPLLIVYSKEVAKHKFSYSIPPHSSSSFFDESQNEVGRFKRSVYSDMNSDIDNNSTDLDEEETMNNTTSMFVEVIPRCKVTPLKINFTELGVSNLIIHPTSYDAGQCTGECEFPMSSSQNPTNHALLLSTLSSLRTSANNVPVVKPPCCTPTKYKPLSMLLYNEEDIVVLRSFSDMYVVSCGCR